MQDEHEEIVMREQLERYYDDMRADLWKELPFEDVNDDDDTPVARKKSDKPLLEPPEIDQRIKDTGRDPFWIPGAFPTIFQNETGDPYHAPLREVDLVQWGPHILRSKGWTAQTHMTFMLGDGLWKLGLTAAAESEIKINRAIDIVLCLCVVQ